MSDDRRTLDTRIVIVVIVAGLLSGGVIAWHMTRPEETSARYSPEYPVAQSQRVPMEMLDGSGDAPDAAHADAGEHSAETEAPSDDDPAPENAGGDDAAGTASGAPERSEAESDNEDARPPEPITDADGRVMDSASDWAEHEGIEYVELTEDLYITISARAVIMAHMISQDPDEYPDPQETMADFMTTQLVKYRVDPRQYYEYTNHVASDNARARRMGEKILREAEAHTGQEINVSDVPGLAPAPVAPPEE